MLHYGKHLARSLDTVWAGEFFVQSHPDGVDCSTLTTSTDLVGAHGTRFPLLAALVRPHRIPWHFRSKSPPRYQGIDSGALPTY